MRSGGMPRQVRLPSETLRECGHPRSAAQCQYRTKCTAANLHCFSAMRIPEEHRFRLVLARREKVLSHLRAVFRSTFGNAARLATPS
jgi:hypothetical protein